MKSPTIGLPIQLRLGSSNHLLPLTIEGKLAQKNIELTDNSRRLIASGACIIEPPLYQRRFALVLPERLDIWFMEDEGVEKTKYPTYSQILAKAITQPIFAPASVEAGVQFAIEYGYWMEPGDCVVIGHCPCAVDMNLEAGVFVLRKPPEPNAPVVLDAWDMHRGLQLNWVQTPMSILFQTFWELERLYPEADNLREWVTAFINKSDILTALRDVAEDDDFSRADLQQVRQTRGVLPMVGAYFTMQCHAGTSPIWDEIRRNPRRVARMNSMALLVNTCSTVMEFKRAVNEICRLGGLGFYYEGSEFHPDKLGL